MYCHDVSQENNVLGRFSSLPPIGRAPKYRTKACSCYWRPKFPAMKWLKCCNNQCSRSRAVSGWVWTPFFVILWGWLTTPPSAEQTILFLVSSRRLWPSVPPPLKHSVKFYVWTRSSHTLGWQCLGEACNAATVWKVGGNFRSPGKENGGPNFIP